MTKGAPVGKERCVILAAWRFQFQACKGGALHAPRQRETERDRDRETETETETERQSDRQRETQRDRETERDFIRK